MMKQTEMMIIGGGASGLAAAVAVKRAAPTCRLCICEKNARVGKKLLATGNGRCNLGNCNQNIRYYHGSLTALLPEIMNQTLDTQTFFAEMGLYCRQDKEGRLYPKSNQAASVLDALRFTAEQMGTEIYCNCAVYDLYPQGNYIHVQTEAGMFQAKAVLVTTGGYAAPKTGSDGSIFSALEKLGHSHPLAKPALVPFYTDPQSLRGLKGIRIRGRVSAYTAQEQCLAYETGEIQFTERSLSGICVMNLSASCSETEPSYLSLDLLPEESISQTLAKLWDIYAARATWHIEDFLTGLFPKKVGVSILRKSGISLPLYTSVFQLSAPELERLSQLCHDWRFSVVSRGNWQEAQVTAGGIPSDEVDKNLQSLYVPGLFFAGEILDLHGNCGGYNLDWAWHSGQYAGQHAIMAAL